MKISGVILFFCNVLQNVLDLFCSVFFASIGGMGKGYGPFMIGISIKFGCYFIFESDMSIIL